MWGLVARTLLGGSVKWLFVAAVGGIVVFWGLWQQGRAHRSEAELAAANAQVAVAESRKDDIALQLDAAKREVRTEQEKRHAEREALEAAYEKERQRAIRITQQWHTAEAASAHHQKQIDALRSKIDDQTRTAPAMVADAATCRLNFLLRDLSAASRGDIATVDPACAAGAHP